MRYSAFDVLNSRTGSVSPWVEDSNREIRLLDYTISVQGKDEVVAAPSGPRHEHDAVGASRILNHGTR